MLGEATSEGNRGGSFDEYLFVWEGDDSGEQPDNFDNEIEEKGVCSIL